MPDSPSDQPLFSDDESTDADPNAGAQADEDAAAKAANEDEDEVLAEDDPNRSW